MNRTVLYRRRRLVFEPFESRLCLSTVAFGLNNIDCCAIDAISYLVGSHATTVDVDGDGDLDVLLASTASVSWLANVDGKGQFGPRRTISTEALYFRTVALSELDGDGDPDVLSAETTREYDTAVIAWHENLDGQGKFGKRKLLTKQAAFWISAEAADMDGDGDLDVLSATSVYKDHKVAWYENTVGRGTFAAKQILDSDSSRTIAADDVDGDGDLDVVSGSSDDGRFAWLEQRLLGDANDDGVFNSSDLVRILQAGKYNDGVTGNSTFDDGDWNGDGEFDSTDLVLALQAGHCVSAALGSSKPIRATAAACSPRRTGFAQRVEAIASGIGPEAYGMKQTVRSFRIRVGRTSCRRLVHCLGPE
jgi:hypothetical protein